MSTIAVNVRLAPDIPVRGLGHDRWVTVPSPVRALVLFALVAMSRADVRWLTRDVGRLLPEDWARFRDGAGVAPDDVDTDLAAAYAARLAHLDPVVRHRAATDWCAWEVRHVAIARPHPPHPHYADPGFRMTSARLVTHYWSNGGSRSRASPASSSTGEPTSAARPTSRSRCTTPGRPCGWCSSTTATAGTRPPPRSSRRWTPCVRNPLAAWRELSGHPARPR